MTTKSSGPPAPVTASSLEAGLQFRLGRAHRTVRAAWSARIADLGLSSAQASTLRAVCERPGTGLRELARTLGTDPMNAKRLADGLEAACLLSSRTAPGDRRIRVLEPTEVGLAMRAEVERRAGAWAGTLDTLLGREDALALLAMLDRLERGVASLDEAPDADDGPGRDA